MVGAAFWRGRVQISWQAQHFHEVKFSQAWNRMAGAALSKGQVQMSWQRSTFERSGTDFVAGAALSQGYRFRGRRSTFTRSCADFVAGAALSQV